MKKNVYITPSVKFEDFETGSDLLVESPNATNIDGLRVSSTDAPTEMVGRSRQSIWDDEE